MWFPHNNLIHLSNKLLPYTLNCQNYSSFRSERKQLSVIFYPLLLHLFYFSTSPYFLQLTYFSTLSIVTSPVPTIPPCPLLRHLSYYSLVPCKFTCPTILPCPLLLHLSFYSTLSLVTSPVLLFYLVPCYFTCHIILLFLVSSPVLLFQLVPSFFTCPTILPYPLLLHLSFYSTLSLVTSPVPTIPPCHLLIQRFFYTG